MKFNMLQIYEDGERCQCVRDIVNLCQKLDSEIDNLIDKHYIKFHQRDSTEEEWNWILLQVQDVMRRENLCGYKETQNV